MQFNIISKIQFNIPIKRLFTGINVYWYFRIIFERDVYCYKKEMYLFKNCQVKFYNLHSVSQHNHLSIRNILPFQLQTRSILLSVKAG